MSVKRLNGPLNITMPFAYRVRGTDSLVYKGEIYLC